MPDPTPSPSPSPSPSPDPKDPGQLGQAASPPNEKLQKAYDEGYAEGVKAGERRALRLKGSRSVP